MESKVTRMHMRNRDGQSEEFHKKKMQGAHEEQGFMWISRSQPQLLECCKQGCTCEPSVQHASAQMTKPGAGTWRNNPCFELWSYVEAVPCP